MSSSVAGSAVAVWLRVSLLLPPVSCVFLLEEISVQTAISSTLINSFGENWFLMIKVFLPKDKVCFPFYSIILITVNIFTSRCISLQLTDIFLYLKVLCLGG